MVKIACNCGKNRTAAGATATVSGTYRVIVSNRQVYESSNQGAAEAVAARFQDAKILVPGESA